MLSLPCDQGIELIAKAREEAQKERMFSQWVAQLPFMGDETYISFNDYVDRLTLKNVDMRPTSEILADLGIEVT